VRRRPVLLGAALAATLAATAAPGAWAAPAAAKPAASRPAASRPAASAAKAPTTAAATASSPAVAASARFGFYGLSPAQAGQELSQAETALGQPLRVEATAARPAKTAGPALASAVAASAAAASTTAAHCHYRSTAQQPGVRYALAGELITRIETRDPRYATVSGVHVGDSLARAQQAYGKRLASSPHPYFDQGRMLTVYSPDRRFALVMETNDAGRIITLRGGRLPEVAWLEGCS
jgi:hypothetical protein